MNPRKHPSTPQSPNCCLSTVMNSRPSPKRKALLIGIAQLKGFQPLRGPGRDVLGMRKLLLKQYGYLEEDIVVLLDSWKNKTGHLMPTRENILSAIDALVLDCQPGDQFVFHYAGHSDQSVNTDGMEDDGMDERILTLTGPILDDELKLRLVDPLCAGSRLVAILDTCHSETLLDLPHYHCNFVPIPTSSSSSARKTFLFRKGSFALRGPLMRRSSLSKKPPPLTVDITFKAANSRAVLSPIQQIMPSPVEGDPITPIAIGLTESLSSGSTSSQSHRRCKGLCSPPDPSKLPYVVAISACKDSQFNWEDERGSCMTQVLIGVLKKHKDPTLRFVMEEVSLILRENAERRIKSPDWKQVLRQVKRVTGKVNKFQHPSLSGLLRLDLNDKFAL